MGDPICFTTRATEPSDRMKAWRRMMAEAFFDLDVRTTDREAFDGHIVKRVYGSVGLTRATVSSLQVIRPRRSLADKVERFCFIFPSQGTFAYRQRGIENGSAPGGVFVVNSAEPYELDHAGGGTSFCLTIPSDVMRARVRRIDDLCAKSGFADPMLTSTLRHLVQETLVNGVRADESHFEDLCANMLELMLSSSGPSRRATSSL